MQKFMSKIRPQILLVILAVTVVGYLVLTSDVSGEVKGTIGGAVVAGIIAIGKDLIQLDKEKDD